MERESPQNGVSKVRMPCTTGNMGVGGCGGALALGGVYVVGISFRIERRASEATKPLEYREVVNVSRCDVALDGVFSVKEGTYPIECPISITPTLG